MNEEKVYLETLKAIKEMKEFVHDEVETLYNDLQNLISLRAQVRELQEEVAKLAGEPVGMLFTHYRA